MPGEPVPNMELVGHEQEAESSSDLNSVSQRDD